MKILLIGLTVLLGVLPAAAVTTNLWTLTTFEDFSAGKQERTAVNVLGRVELAPALSDGPDLHADFVWRAVAAPGGDALYLSAGEEPRVLRVRGTAVEEVLRPKNGCYALAVDAAGRLYAGSFPGGEITRVQDGRAAAWAKLPVAYIWALQCGSDGTLYAACGMPASIWKIDGRGQVTRLLDAGAGHLLSLALGTDGTAYAGSAADGLIYAVAPGGQARVHADLWQAEVVALRLGPDGLVYAGVNPAGSRSGQAAAAMARAMAAEQARRSSASESDAADGELPLPALAMQERRGGEDEEPPQPRRRNGNGGRGGPPAGMLGELLGGCAAVYRIEPSGNPYLVYVSDKETIHDFLVLADRSVWVGTGKEGKVFRVAADEVETQLFDFPATQVTALAAGAAGDIWLATGNGAQVYRAAPQPAIDGIFTAKVFDAQFPARWGKVHLTADRPGGGTVQYRTRAGMSDEPDTLWSAWSAWQEGGSAVSSPAGRYLELQVRLALGRAQRPPVLRVATIAYQPVNQRPLVLDLKVNGDEAGEDEEGEGEAGNRRATADAREALPERMVLWQAADPDGDALQYNLYVQAADDDAWRQVNRERPDLPMTRCVWRTIDFADGWYYLKVVASDAAANAPGNGLSAERSTGPILVDHTLPEVTVTGQDGGRGFANLRATARDAASFVSAAAYNVDNGPWQMLDAADGIFDDHTEQLAWTVSGLSSGAHTVSVRVRDRAGNEAVGSVRLTVP